MDMRTHLPAQSMCHRNPAMDACLLLVCGLMLSFSSVAQQAPAGEKSAEEAARQRERAIERCIAERGVDCETEQGLREWLLQERTREEAEAQGSRSLHQTVPRPAPPPTN